jgi:hypothetical protein
MLPPLAESMAHNHRPPATRITSYTGLPLMYARGRRAGAVDDRPMDGQAAAVLPARSPAATGTHPRRVDRLLMRASSDLALRVRRGHIRAGARRGVQFVERAGADAGLASIRSPCRADRRSAPSNCHQLAKACLYGCADLGSARARPRNHRLRAAIGGRSALGGSGAGWAAAVDRRGGCAAG